MHDNVYTMDKNKLRAQHIALCLICMTMGLLAECSVLPVEYAY